MAETVGRARKEESAVFVIAGHEMVSFRVQMNWQSDDADRLAQG